MTTFITKVTIVPVVTVVPFVTMVTKLDRVSIGSLTTNVTSFYYGYICNHA